jgi:hypothetical protein
MKEYFKVSVLKSFEALSNVRRDGLRSDTSCNRTVGGLHLPKVLKNTTNMLPKYNMCTGTFGHGTKLYMI